MSSDGIDVIDVSRIYEGAERVRAVDGVTFSVARGEVVLVIGPNGSGKTTLLSMLGGLLAPTSGTIDVDGERITSCSPARLTAFRLGRVGFVFQAFRLLDALTARENIELVAQLSGSSDPRRRATEMLEAVGMTHRSHHFARTLSGGEKQRVAIARALVNDPAVILADEPTGSLDSRAGEEAVVMLRDAARSRNTSVVIVSHDTRIEPHADRVLRMADGKFVQP